MLHDEPQNCNSLKCGNYSTWLSFSFSSLSVCSPSLDHPLLHTLSVAFPFLLFSVRWLNFFFFFLNPTNQIVGNTWPRGPDVHTRHMQVRVTLDKKRTCKMPHASFYTSSTTMWKWPWQNRTPKSKSWLNCQRGTVCWLSGHILDLD